MTRHSTRPAGRRGRLLGVLLVALGAALALLPGSALAGETHVPTSFSPLSGAGSGVTLDQPAGIAIDEATGNVFVADAGAGSVFILGEEGGAPKELQAPFSLPGLRFVLGGVGLAYDNAAASPSKGTLYAYDRLSESIKRYSRTTATERYEAAGEMSMTGVRNSIGLNVDQDGNLYAASSTLDAIFKFSPSGTELAKWSVADLLPNPVQVAVDAEGDLFVQVQGNDTAGQGVWKVPLDAAGNIEVANISRLITEQAFGVTYDPASNHIFATVEGKVLEYDATTLEETSEFGAEALSDNVQRLAVSAITGQIYVANSGGADVVAFTPPVLVPDVATEAALDVTGTKAVLNATVNPQGVEVTDCVFEYGTTSSYGETVPCVGAIPTDSEDHPVSAPLSGLEPNGSVYHYRAVVQSARGPIRGQDRTLTTTDTVFTEPATDVANESATLHGVVKPEGRPLIDCQFEYGPTAAYGQSHPCDPEAASIPDDFAAHEVRAELSGLDVNTTYHYRLTMTNEGGASSGEDRSFTTQGAPQILEQVPIDIRQTTATLDTRINPSSKPTTYHFEWGVDASYGNRIPADHDLFAGSGSEPVRLLAQLSGLSPASEYHFRVVATNSFGTTVGPDQPFETLNAAGFPDNRGAELVSPRTSEKGPLAIVGEAVNQFNRQMHYQVAPDGERALFELAPGSAHPTSGGEVLYAAARSAEGWRSGQLSPASLEAVQFGSNGNNEPSFASYVSGDLSCAVFASHMLLAPEAPVRAAEEGASNLYRRNRDGTFTVLTPVTPTNPEAAKGASSTQGFVVAGASPDCSRIYFQTNYIYEGVGVGGSTGELYEWNERATPRLRHVGFVPGPSGEIAVHAEGGGPHRQFVGAVSEDGSRVVFTATRQRAGRVAGAAEKGKQGVFVRIDGSETIDVSESETTTPDSSARYQYATPSGSRVFFKANAGLTTSSSTAGTDLYEYDLEKQSSEHPLTNLSADSNPADSAGAGVAGVIGASEDGARVYFAATGQLVPGKGETQASNVTNSTFNIYLADDGDVSYVGSIRDTEKGQQLIEEGDASTSGELRQLLSRVTPDGRYLLFESSLPFAGYESHGTREAYLYSAEAGSVTCISCRRDGQAPLGGKDHLPLGTGSSIMNRLHPAQTLSEDGSAAFFESPDPLAPGAVAGNQNIYEWRRGAVYLLATAPPKINSGGETRVVASQVEFAGASADGNNAFIVTPRSLAPQDTDGRKDLYDLRIGGGFPAEPVPPAPCSALLEGACQGPLSPPPSPASAATPTFNGPGNRASAGCRRLGHAAKRLRVRAKRLRTNARKASRNNPRSARGKKLRRKASRIARRSARISEQAKRCRGGKPPTGGEKRAKRARASHNRRAGK